MNQHKWKKEFENHLRDILEDEAPLPKEVAFEKYVDSLWEYIESLITTAKEEGVREALEKALRECDEENADHIEDCRKNIVRLIESTPKDTEDKEDSV